MAGASWSRINLKYVSLIALTLQQSIAILSVRYSRTRSGNICITSTVVLLAEVFKLLSSLTIIFILEADLKSYVKTLQKALLGNPADTLRMGLPALIHFIQNNLVYLAANHLDAPTHQVVYQLKIFTTAILSRIILKKRLTHLKWISLAILVVGIMIVQLSGNPGNPELSNKTYKREVSFVGLAAVIGAAMCSGIGSVMLEGSVKRSSASIWIINAQLSLISIFLGILSYFCGADKTEIHTKGFFYGYDLYIVYLIALQGTGGLFVALVSKYADNILKGFAFCVSIVLSCIISIMFFNLKLTSEFMLGSSLVFISTYLYSL